MPYELKLHRAEEKKPERIPKKQQYRLVEAMRSLHKDPRPDGWVKLEDRLYWIHQGEYRIIYAVFEDEVVGLVCKVA
jgi:mRNA-degrading endonuclease RelE of RelBE toxin-antitoxin system